MWPLIIISYRGDQNKRRPPGQIVTQYGRYSRAPQKKDNMMSQGEGGRELEGGSCKPATLRTAGTCPKPEEARKDFPDFQSAKKRGKAFLLVLSQAVGMPHCSRSLLQQLTCSHWILTIPHEPCVYGLIPRVTLPGSGGTFRRSSSHFRHIGTGLWDCRTFASWVWG